MKCEICGKKFEHVLGESFGPSNFLVCFDCAKEMNKIIGDKEKTITLIFELGRIRSFIDIEKRWHPVYKEERKN